MSSLARNPFLAQPIFRSPFANPKSEYRTVQWGKLLFQPEDKVKVLPGREVDNFLTKMNGQIFTVQKVTTYGPIPTCLCRTNNLDRHLPGCPCHFVHSQYLFLTDVDGDFVLERHADGSIRNGRFYAGDFIWVPEPEAI